ncbi:MAG: hypothetical protein AB7F98_15625 [Novosphingobium sp.]
MVDNRLLANIVRRGGGKLLELAIGRWLPEKQEEAEKVPLHKRPLTKGLAGVAVTRLATRSVPGAIVVGGGILAKALYDRRHKRRPEPEDESDA